MRPLFLLLLAACEPTKTPSATSTEDTATPVETGDSAPDSTTDTGPDTSEPPCEGIRLVQAVYYPLGTSIYDLATVPGGFAVSLPEDGSAGSGLIESWTLDQGDLLDREIDEPAATVTGPGARQYLGVQLFSGPDDTLCSQTYGAALDGALYCWPATESGVVDEIATASILGRSGAYFGYGYSDGRDVWAWDASEPGDVASASDGFLWGGLCGADGYCHSGTVQSGVLVATSEQTGDLYAHDLTTGDALWSLDVAGAYAPAYVWSHYTGYVMAASAGTDDTYFRVLSLATGDVVFEGGFYAAGFELGKASTSSLDIEVLTYYALQEDGSAGGIYVYDSEGGSAVASFADLLGYETPEDWDEPFVRLLAMDTPGFFAFAVRPGRVAGVIEVCSTTAAAESLVPTAFHSPPGQGLVPVAQHTMLGG